MSYATILDVIESIESDGRDTLKRRARMPYREMGTPKERPAHDDATNVTAKIEVVR